VHFEVASIKPHPADGGDTRVGIEDNDGFVRISNLPAGTDHDACRHRGRHQHSRDADAGLTGRLKCPTTGQHLQRRQHMADSIG
jgi:hypothetical protein